MAEIVKLNRGYQDLQVWHKAIDLTEMIYLFTKGFPREEMFGITSQMRRAAVSISSNIAEGASRHSQKEFAQFISIALGSMAELKTQLYISCRVGYCDEGKLETILEQSSEVERMLRGLHKSL